MHFEIGILRSGNWTLYRLLQDGHDRVGEYLDRLEIRREEEYAAIHAALDRFANSDVPPNGVKLRLEREGVYALKAGHQQRLYGFYYMKRSFVFVECCEKKRDKADQGLLQRVCQVHREFRRQEGFR